MTADRPTTEPRTAEEWLRRLIGPPEPDGIGDENQHWQNHPEWPDDEAMLLGATVGDLRQIAALLAEAAQGAAPLTFVEWVADKTTDPEIFAEATRIMSEGAAPRAEGLDVERLAEAMKWARRRNEGSIVEGHPPGAGAIADEYARLSDGAPTGGGTMNDLRDDLREVIVTALSETVTERRPGYLSDTVADLVAAGEFGEAADAIVQHPRMGIALRFHAAPLDHDHNIHDCDECFNMASEVLQGAAPRAEGPHDAGPNAYPDDFPEWNVAPRAEGLDQR